MNPNYTDTMNLTAQTVTARMQSLFDRWQSGEITEDQHQLLAEAVLTRATAVSTALADIALSAMLSSRTGQAVPTIGLQPSVAALAGVAAVVAAVSALDATPDRVEIETRAHVLGTAQDAYGDAMRGQGVEYWTRVLNSGACPLCQDLAGDVLPASADMYHHKGCGCTQRPTERE